MKDIYQKIIFRAHKLLENKESFSLRNDDCRILNGEKVQYYLTLSAIDSHTLSIHEIITPQEEGDFQDFFWLFHKKEKGEWYLSRALKKGKRPDETLLERELYDLFIRLTSEKESNSLKVELPEASKEFNKTFNPYIKRIYSYIYLLMGSALLVFGLFATLFVSNIQYNRMARIVNTLDNTISLSADGNDYVIDALSQKIEGISNEVSLLMESKQQEEDAFLFNRFNLTTSVRAQADSLSNVRQYSMKKAYYYLADRMESASSYGELYYHFSRLPNNNSQAETLLATDRDNIIPLSQYESAISYFQYPVRQDGKKNDGEGFMISCGYMDLRLNPLGEGGFKPHYAIDIINIDNIINITEQSVMNREGQSGAIVSPADGIVLENGYSNSYGWYIEIEHPISEEVYNKWPEVTRLTTFFAHMDEPSNWKKADNIKTNEKIGDIGNSGVSTGPHLHYEIRIYNNEGQFTGHLGQKFDGIEALIKNH